MSTSNEATKETAAEPSLTRDVIKLGLYYLWHATNWARPYLGGRRGLIFLAVAVLGIGAALNWGWLVAIGVAPILVALAPCAAMCVLGLCAMKGGGKSCGTQSPSAGADVSAPPSPPAFVSKRAAASNAIASAAKAPAPRHGRVENPDDAADADSGSIAALHAENADERVVAISGAISPVLASEQADAGDSGENSVTRSEPMKERS